MIHRSLGLYLSFVSVLKCIYSRMGMFDSYLCTREYYYYCECTSVHEVIYQQCTIYWYDN